MVATRSNLEAIATRFASAICPEEIFGNLAGDAAAQREALRSQYRALTRMCHPDQVSPADKALATRLFQELGNWEDIARLKIEAGSYGDFRAYTPPAPPYIPVELQVRGRKLKLTGLLAEGVFASVHTAEYEGDAGHAVFAKYTRNAGDNDLLEREYRVLKAIQVPEPTHAAEEFFAKQRAYVPSPLTTFFLLDDKGAKHRANILSVPPGRCFTAETLRRDKYPHGIEPKHVWWIFRRLLLTLWMAHLKGNIHGAVTPDHVLVFPEAHGMVLLDWTCAAKIGEEHVPAINPTYRDFYPPEVFRKEKARPSTDLYMAAATAIQMLGGDVAGRRVPSAVPSNLAGALLSCLHPVAARRPQDAEIFHNEIGSMLGRRVYAEMIVP